MNPSDQTPMFNLKAVVQETGIKPDTLRAWERRYGIPEPQRAESGHRLYTHRDINILKWLMQRRAEGLSISRAVALWRQLENDEADPLEAIPGNPAPARGGGRTPAAATDGANPQAYTDQLHDLCEQWINATMAFDEPRANDILTAALGLFPPEIVCTELIQRGLATIGERWYQGRVTVQQEHFASALATRRLESMLASTSPPTRPGRILVGCPPQEAHTFVPLLLTFLLRRQGWHVIYLGADIPLLSLEATLQRLRPTLVILTAQQLHTATGVLEIAHLLREHRIALGFGGLIFNRFPELRHMIVGHFLGDQVQDAVQTVEEIMRAPRVMSAAACGPLEQSAQMSVSPANRLALAHFRTYRLQIEADVWNLLDREEMPSRFLAAGNANFGRSIEAALTLGNIDYLGADVDWIQGLLANHYRMPAEVLRAYLVAYRQAASRHLGADGQLILDWLDQACQVNSEQSPTEHENAEQATWRRYSSSLPWHVGRSTFKPRP